MALNLRTSSVQNMLRENNGTHCHNFIKDLIAHERSQIAIQVIGNYTPFILASFFAFIFASNAGLRLWIAVQRTPTPYHGKEDTKRTRKTIAALVVLFAVDALGSYYIGRQFPAVREPKIYFGIIMGFLLFSSFNFFLTNVSGLVSVAAHRGITGRPELRTMKDRKMRLALLWITSIVLAYGAAVLREGVSLWLGLASLIFCFARGTYSVRFNVVIYTSYFLSLLVSPGVPIRDYSIQYLYKMVGKHPENERIYTWIMPCFFMAIPGIILSFALRFDYQQHIDAHPETDQSDSLKVVGASATMGDFVNRVGNGVILPYKTPMKFRKTYFNTALTVWLVTQLFYLATALIAKRNGDDTVAAITYLFNFIHPAIQMMCVAIGVKAWIKGDFKKLMSYKETWRSNPVPLPAIEVTCHEEEDEKEKDVVLVLV